MLKTSGDAGKTRKCLESGSFDNCACKGAKSAKSFYYKYATVEA